jgi:hypothetical protein
MPAKSRKRRWTEAWWAVTWRWRDRATYGEVIMVMLLIGTILGIVCVWHSVELQQCIP